MRDPVLQLLGLCARAGKISAGSFLADSAIKEGKAKLVILAEDAKRNTAGQMEDACRFRHVPLYRYGDKRSLGLAVGMSERSVVAVRDAGLAKAIIRELDKASEQ